MKLVFIIPHYHPDTSDHFGHLYQFIEKVADKHEVVLVAETGSTTCEIKGLADYFGPDTSDVALTTLQRMSLFIKLRRQGYKTFYCHYCEISTLLIVGLTRILGGRVFKWHCSQQHLYNTSWSIQTLFSKLNQELPVNLAIKAADTLVTCSPQMKEYFSRYFDRSAKSIAILPNYICLRNWQPREGKITKKKHYTLLFVHRLAPRKGANRLIPLAEKIVKTRAPLKIEVVGGGPLLDSLRTQAVTKKLTHVISFAGPVPNRQLEPYFSKADIFIMPSREEEFGRVQLEAMYYGLPIVATKTISSEFVLNTVQQKHLVSQKNYLDLIDASKQILDHPAIYQRLVEQGNTQLTQFSLKQAMITFDQLVKTSG